MQWQQLVGPLGGAGLALLGVVVTLLFTARQKRKDYRHEFLVGLVKHRYDLYADYVDVLNQNVDLMSGANTLELEELEVLRKLHSLEPRMRVFAVEDVLDAFEVYRSCLRQMAADWDVLTPSERHKILHSSYVAETLSIAMIRADLEVDLFDTWWRRSRRRRRAKRLMASQQGNFDEMKALHVKLAADEVRAAQDAVSEQSQQQEQQKPDPSETTDKTSEAAHPKKRADGLETA